MTMLPDIQQDEYDQYQTERFNQQAQTRIDGLDFDRAATAAIATLAPPAAGQELPPPPGPPPPEPPPPTAPPAAAADRGLASSPNLPPIDNSSPSAFARSFAPYAQAAASQLGIDPTWVAAMAGSESNYGNARGNELFGVKALPGQPGTTMATHE